MDSTESLPSNWSRSRKIREYVADLKENVVRPEIWTISKAPLQEWMEWALRYANTLDPVAPIRKARIAQASQEGEL